jgi:hypothetical protein
MLSIIICHRNIELLTATKKNIQETIGIPYELVVIDNSKNGYTIFSAYNEGVEKAKYNILCFMHEDILFHTHNWGEKVINHFEKLEVGMIGIIGGLAQSSIPSAWWFNNYFGKSAKNLLMRSNRNGNAKLYQYYSNPYNEKDKAEAIVVDGVWFCIRKSLFNNISFDEKTFTGFHLYDADISMQVLQHSKNYIIYDVLIEHKWSGKISKDYYWDLIKFSNKWSHKLPLQSKNVEEGYMKYYNWHSLRSYILEMKTKDFTKVEIKTFLKKYYPVAKKEYNSIWFKAYFFLSKIVGFDNANRIFYRVEKLTGFCKISVKTKTEFKQLQILES